MVGMFLCWGIQGVEINGISQHIYFCYYNGFSCAGVLDWVYHFHCAHGIDSIVL